ncbi:hypothetical protein EGK75_13395 [Neisseria weixii]|uniref:Uncharacterized protein n=1 Tax=Neisseria weixii TaxID=1853276 RepID=A0A3N4MI17_9NEIS|nr:hypothetical protein [Neisseria weixii]RPD83151.1 hypothetical protein EGK74_13350 [Neisseria weixii]RPD83310.1 hypothetical protein EGK75_13395 [Neisseria weixii]
MKKFLCITVFIFAAIVLHLIYPYLSFWNSDIYLVEFGHTMSLGQKMKKGNTNIGIVDGVVDYKIKGKYLLVLNMIIIVHDTSITYTGLHQYWVIKYNTGKVTGPLSDDEFDKILIENKLGKNDLSIPDGYWKYCTVLCGQGGGS